MSNFMLTVNLSDDRYCDSCLFRDKSHCAHGESFGYYLGYTDPDSEESGHIIRPKECPLTQLK